MKKLTTFVSLFIALCQIAFSQKVDVRMDANGSNGRLSNDFYQKNTDFFQISYASNSILTFSIDASKIYKIEGMATKHSGKGKVLIKVSNTNLNIDTTFAFISNISVQNQYEVEPKIIESFLTNTESVKQLGKQINQFLQGVVSKSCGDVIKQANKDLNDKNLREAFQKANSVLNSSCGTEARSIINQIEEKYAEQFCTEKLARIKILANSGIDYKMEMAVDELYQMPEKAKCKDEAINISKQIGEYFLKKNNGSTKVLNLNQVVSKGNSLETIFKN